MSAGSSSLPVGWCCSFASIAQAVKHASASAAGWINVLHFSNWCYSSLDVGYASALCCLGQLQHKVHAWQAHQPPCCCWLMGVVALAGAAAAASWAAGVGQLAAVHWAAESRWHRPLPGDQRQQQSTTSRSSWSCSMLVWQQMCLLMQLLMP
jgi:hypothetical protein